MNRVVLGHGAHQYMESREGLLPGRSQTNRDRLIQPPTASKPLAEVQVPTSEVDEPNPISRGRRTVFVPERLKVHSSLERGATRGVGWHVIDGRDTDAG